jgi:hypothetical protein
LVGAGLGKIFQKAVTTRERVDSPFGDMTYSFSFKPAGFKVIQVIQKLFRDPLCEPPPLAELQTQILPFPLCGCKLPSDITGRENPEKIVT